LIRYKIVVQYDGSKFLGWQIQKEGRTIQGVLEHNFKKLSISKDHVKVYGSGRTDAGVHAWAQVAHVDLKTKLNEQDIQNALNANLPLDCRIIDIEKIEKDFHARYDAQSRFYRYQCYTGDSILYRNQSWILPALDIDYLNIFARQLIGDHDFLSFSKYSKDQKNTDCRVLESKWVSEKKMLTYKIGANRFLHHMIRYLVGTMVALYQKRFSEKEFLSLLKEPRKQVKVIKAPPQGLILERIDYA
tara:strand:- start:679 stop:1413 length:735 start_codon:yes stop_codon:yes gene_type:complete